ncbi:MAG: hypothetical protein ACI9BF_000685 [Candidatus Paceibacteria bacterium]|jgi:hypothetical protein
MKKVIIGFLLIAGVLGAIFYQENLGTKAFYDFQQ